MLIERTRQRQHDHLATPIPHPDTPIRIKECDLIDDDEDGELSHNSKGNSSEATVDYASPLPSTPGSNRPDSRTSGYLLRQPTRFEPVEIQQAIAPVPSQTSWLKRLSQSVPAHPPLVPLFYGPGTTLHLDGASLKSSLLYFVDGKLRDSFDASLIELGLPLGASDHGAERLPYWPNYRDCSPSQRRRYLNWLKNGRCEPDIELGYVFIYFYGLERRILIDQADHVAVIDELLRLLPLYSHSNSFRKYATSLLWATLLTMPSDDEAARDRADQVIAATKRWSDDEVAVTAGWMCLHEKPLNPELARVIAGNDPRSQRSISIKRHEPEFITLFAQKFAERYPTGLPLKASKRPFNYRHHPASSSLPYRDTADIQLPSVLALSSQFKPIIKIWNDCVTDIKQFDRAQKKGTGTEQSAAVYESIPESLRDGDHPHFNIWYSILDRYALDTGWTFVPVHELATTRDIAPRKTLTKSQSHEISIAADCMGLCIEPDPRETGRNLNWDEFISVFPKDEDESEDLATYHTAAILLRLGMTIATADGHVDERELSSITDHIESRFELSDAASVRLEHLAHLLKIHPEDDAKLARKLADLKLSQRETIGDFLISIAVADEVLIADELKALKKGFRSLKLDTDKLDALTLGEVAIESESMTGGELVLDTERIRAVLQETSQVREFLQSVMLDDEEDEIDSLSETVGDGDTTTPPTLTSLTPDAANSTASHEIVSPAPSCDTDALTQAANQSSPIARSVDRRYAPFLEELLLQQMWHRSAADTLARTHGHMLAGAIEAINEWSLEELGDWLIDDAGEEIVVTTSLLKR